MGKKELNEQETRTAYITPALNGSGWKVPGNMREEVLLKPGRVVLVGKEHKREKGERADYVLYNNDMPIGIVEAKDLCHTPTDGLQQAMGYASIANAQFAYSTNGKVFVEHDFTNGEESDLAMDCFPTPEELHGRYLRLKGYTKEEQKIVETPYYKDSATYEPRYYQQNAIDLTVEAVARGQQRILLVMATGTGKTYTAFQIIHRLRKSGAKKKVLYLADRNALIDQTMKQDFRPFGGTMTKIETKANGKFKIDTSYEVYMALYQQLVGRDGRPDAFREVTPDFFDLIIVDECHRGSAREDSEWRRILEYFDGATQIGMTATPKAVDGANNIDYFGEPIYMYSLLRGINDGFLAPYRVTVSYINVDMEGFRPEPGEVDLLGREIADRLYQRQDIGRELAIKKRREIVAHRITRKMHEIGRMTKTIVFCTDVEEAAEMRRLLVKMNSDMCQKYPDYVTRIVGEERGGKAKLEQFIDVNEPTPVIVTTSEMLATGVDCKTCGLIVIDKEIGSMTEFKQIIGRGTRLRPDKGKWHLEILDFRNVTSKFSDPEFDGESLPPYSEGEAKVREAKESTEPYNGGEKEKQPRVKFVVEGQDIEIVNEVVKVLGEDGRTMHTESVMSFARGKLRGYFRSLEEFVEKWNAMERKSAIMEELGEYSILIDAVRGENEALRGADIFDIICHVAFDQKPLSRRERAANVRKRDYFGKYGAEARRVLEALLDKYAEHGILDFERTNILETPPFNEMGKPQKIVKVFGGAKEYFVALEELEGEIYRVV